jgi:uncharacterized protein (UPF0332 family)
MDPLDFIKTANNLKNSREESDRRSSVSRAYYAVFNYVKLYLESCGINIPKDSSAHIKIPIYLKNSGLQNAKQVGKSVGDLKDNRIDADYKMNLSWPNSKDCIFIVLKAELAIKDFDSCKGTALINGIRQYQKIDRGII